MIKINIICNQNKDCKLDGKKLNDFNTKRLIGQILYPLLIQFSTSFFAQIFPLGNIFIKKNNFENLFSIYSNFKSLSIFKN